MLQAFDQLDAATQATATAVINKNVEYLLTVYQDPTYNLWEEHQGLSFFARVGATALLCRRSRPTRTASPSRRAPPRRSPGWRRLSQAHWNGTYYVTLLDAALARQAALADRTGRRRAMTRTSTS